MKLNLGNAKQTIIFLLGPISILPAFILLTIFFGSYSPEEIGHLQKIPLILQGSSDWGGSNIFAVTVACYITFGFTSCIYLNLRLWESNIGNFKKTFLNSIYTLKYHIFFFILGGFCTTGYDNRIFPNDFSNIFILVFAIYLITISWIIFLNSRTCLKKIIIITLSPLFLCIWIFIGWDGITAKSGQLLYAGQSPIIIPLSYRHNIMLQWHKFMDHLLVKDFFVMICINYLVVFLLIGGVLYIIFKILNMTANKVKTTFSISKNKFWGALLTLIVLLYMIQFTFNYLNYKKDLNNAQKILNHINNMITLQAITQIKKDPALKIHHTDFIKNKMLNIKTLEAIDNLLGNNILGDFDFILLIPLKPPFYFYLSQNSSFRYSDVRKIKNIYSKIIDDEIISFIEKTHQNYRKPFISIKREFQPGFNLNETLIGKPILNSSNNIEAIILIDKELYQKFRTKQQ